MFGYFEFFVVHKK